MGSSSPDWLDEQFLSAVLQGGEDQEPRVKVLEFSVEPAVAVGDNYMSDLYRVRLRYRAGAADERSEALVVKSPLVTGLFRVVDEQEDHFSTEPKIYYDLMPMIFEKSRIMFTPRPLFCPRRNAMVMNDLKEEGYVMADKFEQLDFAHCKAVLETLAKFHAASVAVRNEDPGLVEIVAREHQYTSGGEFSKSFGRLMEYGMRQAVQYLRPMDGFENTVRYLDSKIGIVWESVVEACKPRANRLNVINHGDIWTNNVMFKYDSGGIADVKLIDFQIPRLAVPALDVILFVNTSAQQDVREKRLGELHDLYLRALNSTLESLRCTERLSLKEFLEDLKSSVDFVGTTLWLQLPLVMAESEFAIDMANLDYHDDAAIEADTRVQRTFANERYRKILLSVARQFEELVTF